MSDSVTFTWSVGDRADLLATCPRDEEWPVIQAWIPHGSRMLESGCGTGRWVRFLSDRGWKVTGLEMAPETVAIAHEWWPDLDFVVGDCAKAPFGDGEFDAVLSFGVVEHWPAGPEDPLREICRVLRPGGIAIITVPCLNTIRQVKRAVWLNDLQELPRALAKRMLGRRVRLFGRLHRGYRFAVHPAHGPFFEYWMTPVEFTAVVEASGLEVLQHYPSGLMDGVYHELNPFGVLVKFKNWQFEPTGLATRINDTLSRWRFIHPHMQGVVARKPPAPALYSSKVSRK